MTCLKNSICAETTGMTFHFLRIVAQISVLCQIIFSASSLAGHLCKSNWLSYSELFWKEVAWAFWRVYMLWRVKCTHSGDIKTSVGSSSLSVFSVGGCFSNGCCSTLYVLGNCNWDGGARINGGPICALHKIRAAFNVSFSFCDLRVRLRPMFMEVFVHNIQEVVCREGVCMTRQRGSRNAALVSTLTKEPDARPRALLLTDWPCTWTDSDGTL